jgi:aquaglyceroporin related protein
VPLGGRQQSSAEDFAPQDFETSIDGEQVNVHRVGRDEANQVLQDRGIDEHGLQIPRSRQQQPHRSQFGLQDGLPPLQQFKSNRSSESTQTEKEHKEIEERQQQEQREYYDMYRNPLARLRARYPQALAEFLATFIALFLGIAGNLSVLTSDSTQGGFQTQAWAWGLAIMVGIYVGGGISGAHLNPCVSVSLSLFRGFPWKMCIAYVVAQLLAGFCAGGLAYCLYHDSIVRYDPAHTPDVTGKAFYTMPQEWVSVSTAFFTEFVTAAIMICTIFALGDDQNAPPGAGMYTSTDPLR